MRLTVNQHRGWFDSITGSQLKEFMNCLRCNENLEEGRRKFCSTKCKNNYTVTQHRRRLKDKALVYKGGKCERCAYDKCVGALVFHHLDPAQKDFQIGGRGTTRAWSRIQKELDKCLLLCSNCHAEVHAGIVKI